MPNSPTLDDYLAQAERAHGHLCAGQVLGVRMAILGLELLGIHDARGKDRKRLVIFVEIDRCLTDAVAMVTGCRLGKRALKFRDWGKAAATFIDVSTGKAVRLCAKESSKALARELYPELADKEQQQMLAYREMPSDDLFTTQWVNGFVPNHIASSFRCWRFDTRQVFSRRCCRCASLICAGVCGTNTGFFVGACGLGKGCVATG